ncbi:MAG: hypothetical protein ACK5LX_13625 [Oscillospiraceae bacterium]
MGRWTNFIMHGAFATDEMLGKKPLFPKKPPKEEDNGEPKVKKEPAKLEKGDGKAIFLAAIQVFGPIILVLIVLGFLFFWLAASSF